MSSTESVRTSQVPEKPRKRILPKVVDTGKNTTLANQNFTIQLTAAPLVMLAVQQKYKSNLQKAKLISDFRLSRYASPKQIRDSSRAVLHQSNNLAGGHIYLATFKDLKGYIFQKIWPQLFFSIFLFILVALAFGMIYQNWQQQKRLIEQKNDFISNVTHELKTPVSTVSVALEAIQNFGVQSNPERLKEYLSISQGELARLSILIDNVLKMAYFEQKEFHIKTEKIQLNQILIQVVNSMKVQFEKVGAKIEVNNTLSQAEIRGDEVHLTNVIYNLIDNALKYSPEKPHLYIELSQTSGQDLQLIIQDHGQGIDPIYQNKIFDKFFRVPTGNVHNVKGHGLGLSYVWNIVRQHKGKIKVQSTLGEGSIFTLIFPQKNI
jgi:two-component system, OmpR family, phosphate regulon sensor histidine kinase PhoR